MAIDFGSAPAGKLCRGSDIDDLVLAQAQPSHVLVGVDSLSLTNVAHKEHGVRSSEVLLKKVALFSFALFVACQAPSPGVGDDDDEREQQNKVTAQFIAAGDLTQGKAIVFDASASMGTGLQYDYDFGDGSRGGVPRLSHVYARAGEFTVKLSVKDAAGASATSEQKITIAAQAAAARAIPVTFTVRNAAGQPLSGVRLEVIDSPSAVDTDSNGVGSIAVGVGINAAVRATKAGFTEQVRALELASTLNSAGYNLIMTERAATVVLADAALGGELSTRDGGKLLLPANALVDDEGARVTGAVNVAMTPVNVALEPVGFPGRFEAINREGADGLMLSFGVMEFALEQNGKRVNLAAGAGADVEIPIYVSSHNDGRPLAVGDSYPLWSLDEATGLWVQEADGIIAASATSPSGFVLRGRVGHFSWWNCDDFLGDSAEPDTKCRVVDVTDVQAKIDAVEAGACTVGGNFGDARRADYGGPVYVVSTEIQGAGAPLLIPAGRAFTLFGSALGGEYQGQITVNLENGFVGELVIPVAAVDNNPGDQRVTKALPFSETVSVSADTELDKYAVTGTSGAQAQLSLVPSLGSNLVGTFTVSRGGTTLCANTFGPAERECLYTYDSSGTVDLDISFTGAPGAYEISALEFTPGGGANLTLPATISDSVPMMSTKTFTFAGVKGVGYSVSVAAGGVWVRLREPLSGNVTPEVYATSGGTRVFTVIPSVENGTISIDLRAPSASSPNFTLDVSAIANFTVTEATFPLVVSETIPANTTRYYHFTTLTPQQLGILNNRSERAVLIQGVPLAWTRDYGTNSLTEIKPIVVQPTSGDYWFEVRNPSSPQSHVSSVKPVLPIEADGALLPSTTVALEGLWYSFPVVAGQRIGLSHVGPGGFSLARYLYEPDGTEFDNDIFGIPTSSGTWFVGAYSFQAGAINVGLASIEPPVPVTFTDNVYSFTGEIDHVGERDYYSATLAGGSASRFSISAPALGTPVANFDLGGINIISSSGHRYGVRANTGSVSAEIYANNTAPTGPYDIKWVSVPNAPITENDDFVTTIRGPWDFDSRFWAAPTQLRYVYVRARYLGAQTGIANAVLVQSTDTIGDINLNLVGNVPEGSRQWVGAMARTDGNGGMSVMVIPALGATAVSGAVEVSLRQVPIDEALAIPSTTTRTLAAQASRLFFRVTGIGGAGFTAQVARSGGSSVDAQVFTYQACAGSHSFWSHFCGSEVNQGTLSDGTPSLTSGALTGTFDYIIAVEGTHDGDGGEITVTLSAL